MKQKDTQASDCSSRTLDTRQVCNVKEIKRVENDSDWPTVAKTNSEIFISEIPREANQLTLTTDSFIFFRRIIFVCDFDVKKELRIYHSRDYKKCGQHTTIFYKWPSHILKKTPRSRKK